MIKLNTSTPFMKKTTARLEKLGKFDPMTILHRAGKSGVAKLSAATPQDTGETASSWDYTIKKSQDRYVLSFTNSVITDGGTPLVILLHYGHATKNGYFIQGIDFIQPALRDVFKEVTKSIVREISL